jgi:PAS domain S-box-containing protein
MVLTILGLLAGFIFALYRIEQGDMRQDLEGQFRSVQELFAEQIESRAAMMKSALKLVMRDQQIGRAFLLKDRAALLDLATPIFEMLRAEHGITHFYFSDPQRVNLLRVHQPEGFGDRIDRFTTTEAERTGKPIYGLEMGPLGTFTLRVVAPWHDGPRLLGYMEAGMEIDHCIRRIHQLLDVELFVLIEKNHLDRGSWESGMRMLGREPAWDRFSSAVLVDSTMPSFPQDLASFLAKDHHLAGRTAVETSVNKRSYQAGFSRLSDASGQTVGDLVILRDVTKRLANFRDSIYWIGAICIGIGAILYVFFFVFVGRVEGQLTSAHQKILSLEKDRSKFILDNLPAHISLVDKDGYFAQWGPFSQSLFGYSADEALGKLRPYDLILGPEEAREMETAFMGKAFVEREIRGRRKNGALLWLNFRLVKMDGDAGSTELLNIAEDVTDRRRALDMMLESEMRYRGLVEASTDAIVFVNSRMKIVQWNRAASHIFGHREEDVIGRPIGILIPEGHRKENFEGFKRLLDRDQSEFFGKTMEVEGLHKNGGSIPIEVSLSTFETEDSRIYTAILRDITERKSAEQERVRLARAIEQVTENVIITDAAGNIQYVNPSFQKTSGYLPEEVSGKSIGFFKSHEQDEPALDELLAAMADGKTWSGCLTSRKKDGSLYKEEASISPIRDKTGMVTNYVAVKRDVTEEVKLEARVRQAQKMEAIGTLAGGIAHDFNNILSAIFGFAELSVGILPEGSEIRPFLDEVITAAKRARELVKQILAFSRQTEQDRSPVAISLIVKEALKLLRSTLPTTIEVRQKLNSLGTVMADSTEMHQVLMNLCVNAFHAMAEKGGILQVDLDEIHIDSVLAFQSPDLTPGPYIRLTVSDTGHGMDRSVMERIFDPYFTTKEKGKGTGLGLAVVHGIVSSHKGAITVYSEPGKGTTFHVYLPKIETADGVEAAAREEIPGGNESILLVDDEEPIARLEQKMLEGLGYSVTRRTSSVEALEVFSAKPHGFDLLITDMTMPKMTGVDLSHKVLQVRPDFPIILCTGFSELITKEMVEESGIETLLMKPITKSQLAVSIRSVLDEKKIRSTE